MHHEIQDTSFKKKSLGFVQCPSTSHNKVTSNREKEPRHKEVHQKERPLKKYEVY